MTCLGHPGLRSRAAAIVHGLLRPELPRSGSGAGLVVGHRGAARDQPENTIPSFRRALTLGADAIETDVSATSDGRFALWHDRDPDDRVALARQLGAERLAYRPDAPPAGSPWRRPVSELSSEQLRGHYAYARNRLARRPAPGPERAAIAFLEDLLGWAPTAAGLREVFLDVKLSETETTATAALARVVRAAADAASRIRFHLLSPRAEIVAALVAETTAAPSAFVRVSADFELPGAGEIAPRTRADEVSLGHGGRFWAGFRWDVAKALQAREKGLVASVFVWTINDRARLARLYRNGVDGVLTDEPELARSLAGPAREEVRSRAPRPKASGLSARRVAIRGPA